MFKLVVVSPEHSAAEPSEKRVYLRAVKTMSGDGLAIEAATESDFSDAQRLVKVGTIGMDGLLAAKLYEPGDLSDFVEEATNGRIWEIHDGCHAEPPSLGRKAPIYGD